METLDVNEAGVVGREGEVEGRNKRRTMTATVSFGRRRRRKKIVLGKESGFGFRLGGSICDWGRGRSLRSNNPARASLLLLVIILDDDAQTKPVWARRWRR